MSVSGKTAGSFYQKFPFDFSAQKIAFTPDGNLLAIQEPQQTRIWSLQEEDFLYEKASYSFFTFARWFASGCSLNRGAIKTDPGFMTL